MQRAAAFRNATELLQSRVCEVVVLGPASRTWYVDIGHINEIIEYLAEFEALICIAGKLPFDALVEEAAVLAGALVRCVGPTDFETRLKLKARSEWTLESADLVVAFPPPDSDVTAADPIVETAICLGIPVLALYRNEEAKWVTAENYCYV